MLAAWRAAAVTVKPVLVYVISFEVPIDALAARARGTSTWGRLNDNERGLVLLRNLRRRQPGLLQRGILAEQRFLQRPSHTFSLQSVKFLAPSAQPGIAAVHAAGTQPATSNLLSAVIGSPATLLDHPKARVSHLTLAAASALRLPKALSTRLVAYATCQPRLTRRYEHQV
jgi:hypothetical protein